MKAAPRFPHRLPASNPADGKPWALPEPALRKLTELCRTLPHFRPQVRGWHFVESADRLLRDYHADVAASKRLRAWPPRATLQAAAKGADELARVLDRLAKIDAASGLPDVLGLLHKSDAGPDLQHVEAATLRALAGNARSILSASKRGAPKTAGGRRVLIRRLWASWHAATQTRPDADELPPDFLRALALILNHTRTAAALRLDARRALK